MTADCGVSTRELQNLEHLEEHSRGDLSLNYIVQILDWFTHDRPNGVHQCIVFELLGPSVDQVLVDYRVSQDKLYAETIIRISTQLLKAVRFIHDSSMCHGSEYIILAVFCRLL